MTFPVFTYLRFIPTNSHQVSQQLVLLHLTQCEITLLYLAINGGRIFIKGRIQWMIIKLFPYKTFIRSHFI